MARQAARLDRARGLLQCDLLVVAVDRLLHIDLQAWRTLSALSRWYLRLASVVRARPQKYARHNAGVLGRMSARIDSSGVRALPSTP